MDLDGMTTCGSTSWIWVTTSWKSVSCPYCLATRAKVCTSGSQLVADNDPASGAGWQAQAEADALDWRDEMNTRASIMSGVSSTMWFEQQKVEPF